MVIDVLVNRQKIQSQLVAYAKACDQRDWERLGAIFAADVEINYGDTYQSQGRESLLGMVRSFLDGCGPTQHLLANFEIEIENSEAQSQCDVRASHAGVGSLRGVYYEVWATYVDQWRCHEGLWFITKRTMIIHHEKGDRAVLAGPFGKTGG